MGYGGYVCSKCGRERNNRQEDWVCKDCGNKQFCLKRGWEW